MVSFDQLTAADDYLERQLHRNCLAPFAKVLERRRLA